MLKYSATLEVTVLIKREADQVNMMISIKGPDPQNKTKVKFKFIKN
jgi:hypothetical protein